jgi:hypothetical protein
MRVRSRHSSAPSAVAAHTVYSKPPLRSKAPRGRGEAGITDDNRHSVPAGVNGRGCAASLRGPVAAARYATTYRTRGIVSTQWIPSPTVLNASAVTGLLVS